MAQFALEMYTELMEHAIPIAIVFEMGNIIVSTFMRVAFGGKLWFGTK